jgi:hypothetical protein
LCRPRPCRQPDTHPATALVLLLWPGRFAVHSANRLSAKPLSSSACRIGSCQPKRFIRQAQLPSARGSTNQ